MGGCRNRRRGQGAGGRGGEGGGVAGVGAVPERALGGGEQVGVAHEEQGRVVAGGLEGRAGSKARLLSFISSSCCLKGHRSQPARPATA